LADPLDIAEIHAGAKTEVTNSGWNYDRYPELPRLEPKKKMLVADLQGPGVIRLLHFTRHNPDELGARSVVLEIWYDDSQEPAVHCPLADFFGDGCNGMSMDYCSRFLECAPRCYNCYIPMPFKSRARVYLRNDADRKFTNYSFVEWERLPEWNDKLGYFHATYNRKCFQLTPDATETFLEVNGAGHILGRQFSIATEEPLFKNFEICMEGNNEIDIDGQERKIDYLGSEDSFTFSWGFRKTFVGPRAGITLIQNKTPYLLSVYRFHDHLPIRFDESIKWKISWTAEKQVPNRADWMKAVAGGGCWIDYAAVYYWYQTAPGGYSHQPLPPIAERAKPICKPDDNKATDAAGDAKESVPQGEYIELRALLGKLKKHREQKGMSLSDVAASSGMDRSAVSRLENGVYLNPTVDTLYRYAQAVGADIGFCVRVLV